MCDWCGFRVLWCFLPRTLVHDTGVRLLQATRTVQHGGGLALGLPARVPWCSRLATTFLGIQAVARPGHAMAWISSMQDTRPLWSCEWKKKASPLTARRS